MYAACAAWELRDSRKGGGPVRVWIVDPGLVVTNLSGDPVGVEGERGRGSWG